MAINSPRYKRAFIAPQTVYRTVPNGTGVWTNTGAKLLRIPQNGLSITPNEPKTPIPWLTGTRSDQPGIQGRINAGFRINQLQMIPSGAAGTAPDTDLLWQGIFGTAKAVSAGVSVTYAFTDSGFFPFLLAEFPHGVGTLESQLIWGCYVTSFEINLNGNIFDANITGVGAKALSSVNFGTESAVAKAGLTTYPAEPVSPTTNGNVIPGFNAIATIDGNAMQTQIRSARITGQPGFALVEGVLADAYPVDAKGGGRAIGIDLSFIDDDSAALQNLKTKARNNSTINLSITVGSNLAAGNQVVLNMNSVQLIPAEKSDQGDEVDTRFGSSLAHATAIGNVDDFSMVWQ